MYENLNDFIMYSGASVDADVMYISTFVVFCSFFSVKSKWGVHVDLYISHITVYTATATTITTHGEREEKKKIWKIICVCSRVYIIGIYRHSLLPSSLKLYLFCCCRFRNSYTHRLWHFLSLPLPAPFTLFRYLSLFYSISFSLSLARPGPLVPLIWMHIFTLIGYVWMDGGFFFLLLFFRLYQVFGYYVYTLLKRM